MRLSGLPLSVSLGFWLLGCPSDPDRTNFDYLRSATGFAIDTVRSAAPACEEPQKHFDSPEECRGTRKFLLRWERPEEQEHFAGYRIYLDTLPPGAPEGRNWKYVQGRRELADLIVTDVSLQTDSIIFILRDGDAGQDSVDEDRRHIVAFDTGGRMDPDGRFVFALVTEYTGGRGQGQPRYTHLITDDKFIPRPLNPEFKPFARTLRIRWRRPADPTSFFDPTAIKGLIRQYVLNVEAANKVRTEGFAGLNATAVSSYVVGGEQRSGEVREKVLLEEGSGKVLVKSFTLPDSNRADLEAIGTGDSLSLELAGFHPQDTIRLRLFAVDGSGNSNEKSMQDVTLILTDTTQPSLPALSLLEEGRNRIVVEWTASRDSVTGPGGELREAERPNANIMEYRIRRVSADRTTDAIREVTAANRNSAVFRDTLRFLPPGTAYRIRILAVDSSGHESRADSLDVRTAETSFADTNLACPGGFVKIPARQFLLGSDPPEQPDEKPREVENEPFCIESYEHRNEDGFVYNVTWEQAEEACRALAGKSGPDSLRFRMCTEPQWERACEGSDGANPHRYGVQGQSISAVLLQNSCNHGTNDSVMAHRLDKRDGTCLTDEGVYDMAGNFSEWVLDEYDSLGYQSLENPGVHPEAPERRPSEPHVIRGGNFMKPGLKPSELQSLARCDNRDFPLQVRPVYSADCLSPPERPDEPKIVVVFEEARLSGHLCREIPEGLRDKTIREILPNPRDTLAGSTQLFVFFSEEGREGIDTLTIVHKEEEGFGKKLPVRAGLTRRDLLEVLFVKSGADTVKDTLDGRELKDRTNQAALAALLRREAQPPWEAARDENGNFLVAYLHGFPVPATKPAKAYYSSRAISFRCCSRPATRDDLAAFDAGGSAPGGASP